MSRFVILTHDWPFPHWDLMLEQGERLLTWRLLQEPRLNASIACDRSPDHRLHYLDYTGPVSGDRGTVEKWDFGELVSLKAEGDVLLAIIASSRFERSIQLTIETDFVLVKLSD